MKPRFRLPIIVAIGGIGIVVLGYILGRTQAKDFSEACYLIGAAAFSSGLAAQFTIWYEKRKERSPLDKVVDSHPVTPVMKIAIRKEIKVFDELKTSIERTNSLSMVGNILARDFFKNPDFRELLTSKGRNPRPFQVRVVVYDPKSTETGEYPGLSARCRDEVVGELLARAGIASSDPTLMAVLKCSGDRYLDYLERMKKEIISDTLSNLVDLKRDLGHRLDFRLLGNSLIYDSIIVTDDKVIVIDYLHTRGSLSPVFIVEPDNAIGQAYIKEFEVIWQVAHEMGVDQSHASAGS